MLYRDGTTWVGVTAQPLGVRHLTPWDPQRYRDLHHPGLPAGEVPPFLRDESYSESVFTEVGALLRSDEATRPSSVATPAARSSRGVSRSRPAG